MRDIVLAKNRYRYAALGFVILAFCVYLTWAVTQPFDTAPDESMRYQISQYIFQHQSLPFGGDPTLRNPVWGISYGFTPYFAQIIAAVFMKVTSLFTRDTFALVVSARLVSVLCNTGTVAVCFKIADKLFSGLYRWMFVVFIAFLPQFIYIGSYVNSDSSWIWGLKSHWSRSSCIMLAAGLSLCALSYYNAFGFILSSMLLYFVDRLITYRTETGMKRQFWKDTGKQSALIIALVCLLAGWWYVRNAIIYNGDFLGLSTTNKYAQLYAANDFKPSHINSGYNNHWTFMHMIFDHQWLKISYKSMIGCFGYMRYYLNPIIYYIYSAIWGISVLGLFSWIIHKLINRAKTMGRTHKLNIKKYLLPVTLFISIPIPILLSIYYSYYSDFEPQGRYWLPMLIPMMFFITKGHEQLIDRVCTNIWLKRSVQILLCLWCTAIAFFSYFFVLVPHELP
jgi:4-amino-4-deoxy-L-arabinose transferase-like glycosyltransferase